MLRTLRLMGTSACEQRDLTALHPLRHLTRLLLGPRFLATDRPSTPGTPENPTSAPEYSHGSLAAGLAARVTKTRSHSNGSNSSSQQLAGSASFGSQSILGSVSGGSAHASGRRGAVIDTTFKRLLEGLVRGSGVGGALQVLEMQGPGEERVRAFLHGCKRLAGLQIGSDRRTLWQGAFPEVAVVYS